MDILLCVKHWIKKEKPHPDNNRSKMNTDLDDYEAWFCFKIECYIRNYDLLKVMPIINDNNYCTIGTNPFAYIQRKIMELHVKHCHYAGIRIVGINSEVAPGQWGYQLFSDSYITAGHDLWMSRYILMRCAEQYNCYIDWLPKPDTNRNGSGMHTNILVQLNYEVRRRVKSFLMNSC